MENSDEGEEEGDDHYIYYFITWKYTELLWKPSQTYLLGRPSKPMKENSDDKEEGEDDHFVFLSLFEKTVHVIIFASFSSQVLQE